MKAAETSRIAVAELRPQERPPNLLERAAPADLGQPILGRHVLERQRIDEPPGVHDCGSESQLIEQSERFEGQEFQCVRHRVERTGRIESGLRRRPRDLGPEPELVEQVQQPPVAWHDDVVEPVPRHVADRERRRETAELGRRIEERDLFAALKQTQRKAEAEHAAADDRRPRRRDTLSGDGRNHVTPRSIRFREPNPQALLQSMNRARRYSKERSSEGALGHRRFSSPTSARAPAGRHLFLGARCPVNARRVGWR